MKDQRDRSMSGWAVLALGVSISLSIARVVSAEPIVDGRFDPGEGYTDGWYVDFAVEDVSTIVSGGELWLHEDSLTGDVAVVFIQPVTLVDNTYGDNSIGWGRDVAPSGKNHNFKDLVGSDKAEFVFTNALGDVVLDVTMDYISETSRGSGVYRCLGVTGGDGEASEEEAALVLGWGSSLDYNFNTLGFVLTEDSPATDEDYTENPLFGGWVFEIAYEMRVSGDAFGPSGFGEVTIPIVHDSPNKIGKNKVYPDIDGPVPEPATMSLLMLGGGLILFRLRARRTISTRRAGGRL